MLNFVHSSIFWMFKATQSILIFQRFFKFYTIFSIDFKIFQTLLHKLAKHVGQGYYSFQFLKLHRASINIKFVLCNKNKIFIQTKVIRTHSKLFKYCPTDCNTTKKLYRTLKCDAWTKWPRWAPSLGHR
jgi:hypothetical protein